MAEPYGEQERGEYCKRIEEDVGKRVEGRGAWAPVSEWEGEEGGEAREERGAREERVEVVV